MADVASQFISPDPHVPRLFYRGEGILPRNTPYDARHSYTKVAERLEHAVQVVADRVRVDPSSRVAKWTAALSRLASANKRAVLEQLVECLERGEWDHPYRDSFLALSESRMFIEIVDNLLNFLTDRELRELVSGHQDPALDRASARGRDREFEWYIAAILRRGGLHVALAEPDLLVRMGGEIRAIAAKRLTSRRQLQRNIKKASAQIAGAGYQGYIFLELTRYIDPEVRFIEHWRDESRPVGIRLDRVARMPALVDRRNESVQGAFLRAAFPRIFPGYEYGTFEHLTAVAVSGGNKEEHVELTRALYFGMQGV